MYNPTYCACMHFEKCYSPKLKCKWKAWQVHGPKHLLLITEAGMVTEITSCVEMATFIMPDCEAITVYDGKYNQAEYRKINKLNHLIWESV